MVGGARSFAGWFDPLQRVGTRICNAVGVRRCWACRRSPGARASFARASFFSRVGQFFRPAPFTLILRVRDGKIGPRGRFSAYLRVARVSGQREVCRGFGGYSPQGLGGCGGTPPPGGTGGHPRCCGRRGKGRDGGEAHGQPWCRRCASPDVGRGAQRNPASCCVSKRNGWPWAEA